LRLDGGAGVAFSIARNTRVPGGTMSWIGEALETGAQEVIEEASVLVTGRGAAAIAAVPNEVILEQVRKTLQLLVDTLGQGEESELLGHWEAVGRDCSEGGIALAEVPDATDVLKRAIWTVMERRVESGQVDFKDLVESMMDVESILADCRVAMIRSYLGSRAVEETATSARLEAMHSLTELLSTESDKYQVFQALVDKAAEITGLSRCTLLVFGEDGSLEPVASNFADSMEHLRAIPDGLEAALAGAVRKGVPLVVERGSGQDPGSALEDILDLYRTPTVLIAPLKTDVKPHGVMLLDEARDGKFSDEQVQLAMAVAQQAAIAIEKSDLLRDMEKRLKHMAAIGIVARTLPSYLDPRQQLHGLLEIATAIVKADRGAILLPDEMFGVLSVASRVGPEDWDAEGPALLAVAKWVYENGEPASLEKGVKDPRFPLVQAGVEASITAPLTVRSKSVGAIYVGTAAPGARYDDDDLELFNNFAAQSAISVENTQLYERLQDTYLGAIGSLAAAIEARDPYTVGHSARVTQYAVAIAESMGLPQENIEELRLAGLLHDLGKIGVPDRILNKPGRLTEEEYSAIKMHPALSMRIIEPLPHLGNIIPIIYHHHEHYDGSGYVDGKVGEKIPLGARIIAVADAFEAMTSDRPYRTALSRDQAMTELRRNAGSQFDPRIVAHFLDLLDKTTQGALE